MPRERKEEREQARKLWLEAGAKDSPKGIFKAIADKLNTSVEQIRKWKSLDDWEGKRKVTISKNNENVTKQKGAPKGNKNAVGNKGGAAPKGNKNNYKHGIFEKIVIDFLPEDEKELFFDRDINEIEELKATIRMCDLQIIQFMKKIKKAEEIHGGLTLSGVTKTKTEGNDEQLISDTTSTHTTAVYELVLKYNNEIEKAKAKKIRCLETLIKLTNDNERIELEKQRLQLLKDKTEIENIKEDNQNVNVQIYIPDNKR